MDGMTFAYFGVNPSTADATIDDATVRKWIGFTKKNGGRRFIVGNVFAYRSTDVRALATADDPVGPQNADYLKQIADEADVLVPCWGNTEKVPPGLRPAFNWISLMLMHAGKPVRIFGRCANGDPKHPLMLGYDTPLVDFRIA
jgi:hypothetical protein